VNLIAHKPSNLGIYLIPDAARILRVPMASLRTWVSGRTKESSERHYPAGPLVFNGAKADKYLDFHTLIELFTIAQLRARGVSMTVIRDARLELSERFKTPHPFAMEGLMTSDRTLIKSLNEDVLLELGTNGQTAFRKVIQPFCESLDFDQTSSLASRYYPLGRNQPIVVDPHHAFGRPVIEGTNITTEAVISLLRGGDAVEDIAESFQIDPQAIIAARTFEQIKAA
jgi:uncharacterized protein (DUF433 family)